MGLTEYTVDVKVEYKGVVLEGTAVYTRKDYSGVTFYPKHDSSYVTYRRPSTTSVCCKDNYTTKEPTVFLVCNKFSQQCNHND